MTADDHTTISFGVNREITSAPQWPARPPQTELDEALEQLLDAFAALIEITDPVVVRAAIDAVKEMRAPPTIPGERQ